MVRRAPKPSPDDFPEFPVKREVLCSMLTPPLGRTAFFDRVKKGKIVSVKGLSGYYLLNQSLHPLGIPMVRELPGAARSRSLEDITRLAFTLIDPATFPAPSLDAHGRCDR